MLFPIRVDDAIMDTTEQWAHDIKRTRHIGDFTRWKEHDAYQKALGDRRAVPPAVFGTPDWSLRGQGRG